MKKEPKIVCVEWLDASFHNDYYDNGKEDEFKPIMVKTVGHLIKEDKNLLV